MKIVIPEGIRLLALPFKRLAKAFDFVSEQTRVRMTLCQRRAQVEAAQGHSARPIGTGPGSWEAAWAQEVAPGAI